MAIGEKRKPEYQRDILYLHAFSEHNLLQSNVSYIPFS